ALLSDGSSRRPPLRLASPLSHQTWAEDFHLQAVKHARHTPQGFANLAQNARFAQRPQPFVFFSEEEKRITLRRGRSRFTRFQMSVDMGDVQRELGDFTNAETSFQRALAIGQELDHPVMVQALGKLGGLYFLKQDYAKTARMLQQAVAMAARTLGEEHPEFLSALSSLGSLHLQMADYDQPA